MKRYLILLIPALVLLGSCERETDLKGGPFSGKVRIIPSSVTTRSEVPGIGGRRNFQLSDGTQGSIRVEETLTSIDAIPTRGNVVRTGTVASVYGEMTVAAYSGGTLVDGEVKTFSLDGNKYVGDYDEDPWASGAVDFFMLMGGGTPAGYSGGSFSFSYSSPSTAAAQNDLLFSSRGQLSESTYNSEESAHDGAAATFHHALSAVSFSLANETETTYITSITVNGLFGSGSCTYAADGSTPSWTTSGSTGSYTGNAGDIFWFIPQGTAGLTLDITFSINGEESTMTNLAFGSVLNNRTWDAGEYRKYALSVIEPYDVIIVLDNSQNINAEAAAGSSWTVDDFGNRTDLYYLYDNHFYQVKTHSQGNNSYLYFSANGKDYHITTDGGYDTSATYHKSTTVNVTLYTVSTSASTNVKTEAKNAIDNVAALPSEPGRIHRVAIVSFAGSASTVETFTEINSASATSLKTAVDNITITSNSISRADQGLSYAERMFNPARSSKKVIIFITGSYPSSSTIVGYDSGVAGTAITTAENMSNVSIYSVWAGRTYSFLPVMDSFLEGVETQTDNIF